MACGSFLGDGDLEAKEGEKKIGGKENEEDRGQGTDGRGHGGAHQQASVSVTTRSEGGSRRGAEVQRRLKKGGTGGRRNMRGEGHSDPGASWTSMTLPEGAGSHQPLRLPWCGHVPIVPGVAGRVSPRQPVGAHVGQSTSRSVLNGVIRRTYSKPTTRTSGTRVAAMEPFCEN